MATYRQYTKKVRLQFIVGILIIASYQLVL